MVSAPKKKQQSGQRAKAECVNDGTAKRAANKEGIPPAESLGYKAGTAKTDTRQSQRDSEAAHTADQ